MWPMRTELSPVLDRFEGYAILTECYQEENNSKWFKTYHMRGLQLFLKLGSDVFFSNRHSFTVNLSAQPRIEWENL